MHTKGRLKLNLSARKMKVATERKWYILTYACESIGIEGKATGTHAVKGPDWVLASVWASSIVWDTLINVWIKRVCYSRALYSNNSLYYDPLIASIESLKADRWCKCMMQ